MGDKFGCKSNLADTHAGSGTGGGNGGKALLFAVRHRGHPRGLDGRKNHASFTFGIEGISRACSHQLVRHRIASYSQQSQRYVDGTKFDFVTPPAIRENPKALEAYNRVLAEQAQAYSAIRDALAAGYIAEYLGEPQEGTDAEIIERFKTSHAACKTSLRTAAVTAPSGRSVR